MSASVCLSVCLSVSLPVCLSVRMEHAHFRNHTCTVHVAVARFFSCGVVICYVLPVLRMTSGFFYNWLQGGVTLLQQHGCSVVSEITFLLRGSVNNGGRTSPSGRSLRRTISLFAEVVGIAYLPNRTEMIVVWLEHIVSPSSGRYSSFFRVGKP